MSTTKDEATLSTAGAEPPVRGEVVGANDTPGAEAEPPVAGAVDGADANRVVARGADDTHVAPEGSPIAPTTDLAADASTTGLAADTSTTGLAAPVPLPHVAPVGAVETASAPDPLAPAGAVVAEAPVPSGPYRTPPYEAPPAPLGGRVLRPLLGPALGTFGALSWSYVVAGQLTTSWLTGRPLGNRTALAAVFVATVTAWVVAMRRSHAVAPASPSRFVGRIVGVGALAFAMFVASLLCAMFVGASSSRGHDFAIAFGLVVVAVVAVVLGDRFLTPEQQERTHGQRVVTVALWAVSLVVTLVAGIDLAANG